MLYNRKSVFLLRLMCWITGTSLEVEVEIVVLDNRKPVLRLRLRLLCWITGTSLEVEVDVLANRKPVLRLRLRLLCWLTRSGSKDQMFYVAPSSD